MAQQIVAHRGASYDAPENTLAAFKLAWEQNADGVEGDYRLSKDGHIVCIHDETTKRTAGVDLEIAKSTLAELRELDVGAWKDKQFAGERVPTLPEVIATVPKGKLLVVELKTGPEIIAPLKQVLEDSPIEAEQVLVIAFDKKTIAESKQSMPRVKAHWLTKYERKYKVGPWGPSAKQIGETIRRIQADGLGSKADRNIVTKAFVSALRDEGVSEFHLWTVDEPENAKYYQALGAFGITTNRPGLLRRELELEGQ